MPHRAGYFVLAYQWDHHCNDLLETLRVRFIRVLTDLTEMEKLNPKTAKTLLAYYENRRNKQILYQNLINDMDRKKFVIQALGYRGYGVNYDLLSAIEALKDQYDPHVNIMLKNRFSGPLEHLKKTIRITKKDIEAMDSARIIKALWSKMKARSVAKLSQAESVPKPDFRTYFRIMSEETSWPVNTAIFQKLFLNLGSSSMTIMKGSSGYEDTLSEQELKLKGNRNFLDMYRETFANLHIFTDIGIDLLKRIHYILSRDIVATAGDFRQFDFPDKNGVTMEFGNFNREIGDLSHVLMETARSFDDLDSFIYNLARSYYMIIGIHPFWDSNGRVGRCFVNYMLIKKGLPPVSFMDEDEIFALPRYGGDMKDMHSYLKDRLRKAMDAYYKERWKFTHFGFIPSGIRNVSFDSGFHFRMIENGVPRLETSFQAFIIDDRLPISAQCMDQCRVTLQDEKLLGSLIVYCGFSYERCGRWEHIMRLRDNFFIHEIESETQNSGIFEVSFILELHGDYNRFRYFNCCVVSEAEGYETRIFNNKGLNYSYELEQS